MSGRGRPSNDDNMLLHYMAMLIVDGKAGSPWEATSMVARWCKGASPEGKRKRLLGKYNRRKAVLESGAKKSAGRRSDVARQKRFRETARAFSEASARYDTEKLRVRELIEADHDLMEVVEHLRSNPNQALDLIPGMIIRLKAIDSE